MSTYLLRYFSNNEYFLIISFVGLVSTLQFCFVPNFLENFNDEKSSVEQNKKPLSFRESLN